ncbi:RRT15 protein, partial [Acromyrmex charruanus]
MVGVCETRAESSGNDLTELKRWTGQAPPRELVNANQSGKNNNLNVGPKRDKIAKDIINAPKGPVEAQSVSKKIKLTRFASVHLEERFPPSPPHEEGLPLPLPPLDQLPPLPFQLNPEPIDWDRMFRFFTSPSYEGNRLVTVYIPGNDKTNLSHDDLNPAHVPCWRVNNPTLGEFCFAMIGRTDIEGSKSNVAMNVAMTAWPSQASYPCGSIGRAFAVSMRTEHRDQANFCPFALREISVLAELALGYLRYSLTDVPPQSNSPSGSVLESDHAGVSLYSKENSSRISRRRLQVILGYPDERSYKGPNCMRFRCRVPE